MRIKLRIPKGVFSMAILVSGEKRRQAHHIVLSFCNGDYPLTIGSTCQVYSTTIREDLCGWVIKQTGTIGHQSPVEQRYVNLAATRRWSREYAEAMAPDDNGIFPSAKLTDTVFNVDIVGSFSWFEVNHSLQLFAPPHQRSKLASL